MKKAIGMLFAVLCFCSVASAWNCPTGQIRQQAPAGTSPSTPYYDVVEGIAFICVPATPPTAPNGGSNASNSTSNSTSNSSSTSGSSSQSIATGGQSSSKSNATGGSVVGSGNSSVSNTVTATGGSGGNSNQHQGQQQSVANSGNSSQSQSADNGGQSNEQVSNTNIPRQTATAVAPTVVPSSPCFKGFGAAAQTPVFGASFGAGKIDVGCDDRETARIFYAMGNSDAAARILCSTPAAKRAKLVLADCLPQVPSVTVEQSSPAVLVPEAPAPQPITINVPAPTVVVIPAPVVAPAPSIVTAAQATAAAKKVHHNHPVKPCIDNENLSKHTGS